MRLACGDHKTGTRVVYTAVVVDTAVVVSTWCGGGRGLVVVVRGARKSREWDGEAELDCPLGSIASGRGRTPRNGQ